MIRITYFKHKCIGCSYCSVIAPDRWSMNDYDGKSILLDGSVNKQNSSTITVPDTEFDLNKEAADLCTSGAIKIEKI